MDWAGMRRFRVTAMWPMDYGLACIGCMMLQKPISCLSRTFRTNAISRFDLCNFLALQPTQVWQIFVSHRGRIGSFKIITTCMYFHISNHVRCMGWQYHPCHGSAWCQSGHDQACWSTGSQSWWPISLFWAAKRRAVSAYTVQQQGEVSITHKISMWFIFSRICLLYRWLYKISAAQLQCVHACVGACVMPACVMRACALKHVETASYICCEVVTSDCESCLHAYHIQGCRKGSQVPRFPLPCLFWLETVAMCSATSSWQSAPGTRQLIDSV